MLIIMRKKNYTSFVNTLYNTVDWKTRENSQMQVCLFKLDKCGELELLLRMGEAVMALVRFPLDVLQKKDGNSTSN